MPTYEYRCPEGHTFDVFQRMSDEPGAECPTCGVAAERQISAGAGLLFKGSGFYITDSRSPEYAKKASAEQSQTTGAQDAGGKDSGETGSSAGSDAGSGSGGTDSKGGSRGSTSDTTTSGD